MAHEPISFYQHPPDNALRFGDVVRGFPLSTAHIDNPAVSGTVTDFQIDVAQPDFGVVMTPCCSIGDKTLLLAPLIMVLPKFYENPYFAENLLHINSPMLPEQSVAPGVWEKMPQNERDRRLNMSQPKSLAFLDLFVYAPHEHLPSYTVRSKTVEKETSFYMINFRMTCPVKCPKVASAKQAPLHAKRLQLSVPARSILRDKVAGFYARVPDEDKV